MGAARRVRPAEASLRPRLRRVALGAAIGVGFGGVVAALLAGPHAWGLGPGLVLALHCALIPAAVGAAIGLLPPVQASALGALLALFGVYALASDLQPAPPPPPSPAHGPEVAGDGVAVLVIAVDGADWRVLRPLIDAGEAPHLAALAAQGASLSLQSLPEPASPVVWTTVATGRAPRDHGIEGFLSPTLRFESPLLGRVSSTPSPRLPRWTALVPGARVEELPVTSLDRRTTAVWNQASAAGRSVATVGWWGTWPAERVLGVQVSDHASYQRLNASASAREVAYGQVTPARRLDAVRAAVVAPADVEDPLLPARSPYVEHDPVSELRVALAAMQTYGALGEQLVAEEPDLAMVYFQAVDIASHYFWSFGFGPGAAHPPPSAEDRALYGDVVNAIYRRQDAWVGRLVEAFGGVGPERAVVVLSDHGFGPAERVQSRSPHVTGTHRRDGVFIAAGGPFLPGATEAGATVFDVAPTVLHLLGLPPSEEMPGRVLETALRGAETPARVKTWDGAPGERPPLPPSEALDRDKIELLRSLGYLD